jgi:hypothetical protein
MDTSLDNTIDRLDTVLEVAAAEESRLGVFPAMYRSVTVAVRDAVRSGGLFDDDARLEELTVVFAGEYLDAWERFRGGEMPAEVWNLAFTVAESRKRRMILQHLLLGMNAHINLDLGIATSRVAGDRLPPMYADFIRVNEILFAILDSLQAGLGSVSPRMSLLDRIGGRWDESFMRMGIRTARDLAWHFAEHLADEPAPEDAIRRRDEEAAWAGRFIARRWSPLHIIGLVIARAETTPMTEVIDALSVSTVDLDAVERRATEERRRGPMPAAPLKDVVKRTGRRRFSRHDH